MYNKILSVTAVNNYIKKVIDNDFILRNSFIKGELSNVKIHSSGHIYFSLKDNFTKLKCIMFRSKAIDLKFIPQDGMQVVVSGNVTVYEKEGTYQLYCDTMEVQGEGELYAAYNKLKSALENEGLFDAARKKDIPAFPRKIGVVTSPTGAAIRDIIKVATRRNPKVNIIIYPALVQGINAAEDIAKGIAALNKTEDVDLIIIGRGGGSIEELWAFNEERVARAVAASKTPIISAVGHETDFTIADFVADLRAATPSHGAEMAVYNLMDLESKLYTYKNELNYSIEEIFKLKYDKLKELRNKLKLYSPENYIINQYEKLDNMKNKLNYLMRFVVQQEKGNLQVMGEKLEASNPLKILNKGYGIISDDQGKTIESIKDLKGKNRIKITMKDGSMLFDIEGVEE